MSNELIRAMFKHLLGTYTLEETREILTAKFPNAKTLLDSLEPEDFVEETRVQEARKERAKADKKEREVKPKKERKTRGNGNKEKAMEIYKKNLDKNRKTMIEILVNELDVTPSTGSNLYHWCKRELN